MVADSAAQLRLLAAEVRTEQGRIGRTVAELTAAVDALGRPDATRLQLYGVAALQRAISRRRRCGFSRTAFPLRPQPQ